ncbi:hypothetical protein FOCC_FOCC000364 [Frankliniella occidentalis]|nr:hypothetical protein FOCC_FOCC000364 [Frankliniella occidentalis]
MAPNVKDVTSGVLYEHEEVPDYTRVIAQDAAKTPPKSYRELQPILWDRVVAHALVHLTAIYTLTLVFSGEVKLLTLAWAGVLFFLGSMGILVGAHRLWSHRTFRAKLPTRIALALMQGSIFRWSVDHRTHHKFVETDADHVNARRGFFFSHIGWLLMKKHPDVAKYGKMVDMSDMIADPVVYYYAVWPFMFYLIPVAVPMYAWGETHTNAFLVAVVLRFVVGLNATFLVNSAAHAFGSRPYDATIAARENPLVSFIVGGEGYHNYHHVFPWDYQASEIGNYVTNPAGMCIDFLAAIGQATDLKTVNKDMINARSVRTGDGTRPVWGWGDADLSREHKGMAVISNVVEELGQARTGLPLGPTGCAAIAG